MAQKPWVRVTPWPVFSKTHVTVSPFLRLTVAVWVFRSPTPVLPPEPVTVQLYGVFGSVEPPIPVRTQPSGTSSFTVYEPALSVWLFIWPPARLKSTYGGVGLASNEKLVNAPSGLMSFLTMIVPGWSLFVIVHVLLSPTASVTEPLAAQSPPQADAV